MSKHLTVSPADRAAVQSQEQDTLPVVLHNDPESGDGSSDELDAVAAGTGEHGPIGSPALQMLSREEEEDKRRLRWALAAAILFHVALLVVTLPELVAAPKDIGQHRQKVYVVQQVRFKQPLPQQQPKVPPSRKKKIPVPDPTPNEPEPIRELVDTPEITLPDTDAIFEIPGGPADGPVGPLAVGGDVKAPEKIFAPQPKYTEEARNARIQGIVILQAIIDAKGNVTRVRVLKGLPMGLAESAVEAVNQWKFKPATLEGKPVPVYFNLTVSFSLQ